MQVLECIIPLPGIGRYDDESFYQNFDDSFYFIWMEESSLGTKWYSQRKGWDADEPDFYSSFENALNDLEKASNLYRMLV
jgi:hypothetical protein